MKSNQFKVKILILGPQNVGKSRIANFLADVNSEVPEDVGPTDSLRILEYDINNLDLNGNKVNVDLQLWDTSGKENCMSYWPILRKNADGIVFVYSNDDEEGTKKLDYMYNYFISQQNFSLRACLVCSLPSPQNTAKLSSTFSKISQINVNLESNASKFRQEFSKYIASVINTLG